MGGDSISSPKMTTQQMMVNMIKMMSQESGGGYCSGKITMIAESGTYGFITSDEGDGTMFVMPAACEMFGGVIPPIGTSVLYSMTVDPKSGRLRAEDVQPGLGPGESLPQAKDE